MMGNRELLWSQGKGIRLNLELIWAAPSYFTFVHCHPFSSRLVRDFWGALCSSVKQIKSPSLFDWEQGIALHAMQGNWLTFQFHLGYNELFEIPAVTSVSL